MGRVVNFDTLICTMLITTEETFIYTIAALKEGGFNVKLVASNDGQQLDFIIQSNMEMMSYYSLFPAEN